MQVLYVKHREGTHVQAVIDTILKSVVYPCIKFALGCVSPFCLSVLRAIGALHGCIVIQLRAIWDGGVHVTPMKHAYLRGEWVYADKNNKKFTILYLHGGAFIAGSPAQSWSITSELARQLPHGRLLVIDYRKAPEHPFPAGLDDCISAYRHLIYDLQLRADSIVLMGDSAGGNLAMALALYCGIAQLPKAAALVGLSPWLNPFKAVTTLVRHAMENEDPILPVHLKDNVMRLYLSGQRDRGRASVIRNTGLGANWLISPMMATDEQLRHLPPFSIQVGANDALMNECTMFVERAAVVRGRDGATANELIIWEGLPHVFQLFPGFIPEARKSLRHAAFFVTQHTLNNGRSDDPSHAIVR